jgi:hypothetical protein
MMIVGPPAQGGGADLMFSPSVAYGLGRIPQGAVQSVRTMYPCESSGINP